LLAVLLLDRDPGKPIEIVVTPESAALDTPEGHLTFPSTKNLPEQAWHLPLEGADGGARSDA